MFADALTHFVAAFLGYLVGISYLLLPLLCYICTHHGKLSDKGMFIMLCLGFTPILGIPLYYWLSKG